MFILSSVAILAVGYYSVRGSLKTHGGTATGKSGPQETLDHFRDKAKDIEKDTQRRADDLMRRTSTDP